MKALKNTFINQAIEAEANGKKVYLKDYDGYFSITGGNLCLHTDGKRFSSLVVIDDVKVLTDTNITVCFTKSIGSSQRMCVHFAYEVRSPKHVEPSAEFEDWCKNQSMDGLILGKGKKSTIEHLEDIRGQQHPPTSDNSKDAFEKFLKFDECKLMYSLIPQEALDALASVLTYGAKKYAAHNWKKVDNPTRYEDALYRHLAAWRKGEALDSESGLPHLHHALTNLAFLVYLNKGE